MKWLIFILGITYSASSFAHAYYFSFAELEYNSTTNRFELSLQASTHDVEISLKKQGLPVKELELQTRDSILKKGLETWLLEGFQTTSGTEKVTFHLLGFEVMPNGLLYAYLESEPTPLVSPLHVKFDLLMREFSEQQNKITFTANRNKQTAVFLPSKPEEDLIIAP